MSKEQLQSHEGINLNQSIFLAVKDWEKMILDAGLAGVYTDLYLEAIGKVEKLLEESDCQNKFQAEKTFASIRNTLVLTLEETFTEMKLKIAENNKFKRTLNEIDEEQLDAFNFYELLMEDTIKKEQKILQ